MISMLLSLDQTLLPLRFEIMMISMLPYLDQTLLPLRFEIMGFFMEILY